MSYCATCGRQREGTARFCGGCGTEYTDQAGPQPSEQATAETALPPGATRLDLAAAGAGVSGTDGADAKPDPFAGWYQQAPPTPPGGQGDGGQWQPTETVQAAPARPGGYGASPTAPPSPYQPGSPPPPYQPASYQPGAYQPGGAPGGPPRGGRRGLFIAVAVVVVLAAGGGAYALASSLGKHPVAQPSTGPSVSTTAPASGSATVSGSTPAAAPSASASPSVTATPSPSLSLVAGAPGGGSVPPQVETLLSHYFHGINSHSYAEYSATLDSAQKAKQPESTFNSGYASTTDSGMTLTALAPNGSGLTATVTFISRQSTAQSVDHSACNNWTLSLYLVPAGSGYLIGPAPSGYQPHYSDC